MRVLEGVRLAVERPIAGVVVISVAGDLDRVTSQRVRALIEHQVTIARSQPALARGHVVVDLSDVRSVAAGGLDALADARRRTEAAGMCLHVSGAPETEAAPGAGAVPAVARG